MIYHFFADKYGFSSVDVDQMTMRDINLYLSDDHNHPPAGAITMRRGESFGGVLRRAAACLK